jgi:hypothetical protein
LLKCNGVTLPLRKLLLSVKLITTPLHFKKQKLLIKTEMLQLKMGYRFKVSELFLPIPLVNNAATL